MMKLKGWFGGILICTAFFICSCNLSINPWGGNSTSDLFPISQNGKFGYISRTGEVVIQPQFATAFYFSDGLAAACIDHNKCGFIDGSGKFVINPQFASANRFSEGLAAVVVEGKLGFVDKAGKFVINPQFDLGTGFMSGFFSEGLANIKLGDKYGFVGHDGKIAINPQFDYAAPFFDGLAAVQMGAKWGFIDKDAKIVINPQFDHAQLFCNGLAAVKIGEQFGYIDKTGKIVINPQFKQALPFSDDGIALIFLGDKIGFIDKEGKYLINPQFLAQSWSWEFQFWITSDIGYVSFSEGMAPVQVGEKKAGYIDKTGNIVINPQFNIALPFYGGLAQVYTDSGMAYIDKAGNYVWRETKPSANSAADNANRAVANSINAAANSAQTATNYVANVANTVASSISNKTGRLTTDSNIRSEGNKDATSLGIHFKGAKIRILDETSYTIDTGELSTWYKVRVTDYGCSVNANLGCGKNPNSADEGWVNAKNVLID